MDVRGGCEAPRQKELGVRNKNTKGTDDNCELGEVWQVVDVGQSDMG